MIDWHSFLTMVQRVYFGVILFEGNMIWDRKGEVPDGKAPFYSGQLNIQHPNNNVTPRSIGHRQ